MDPNEVTALEHAMNLPFGNISNVSHSHHVSPDRKLAHVEDIIRETIREVDGIYEPYRTYDWSQDWWDQDQSLEEVDVAVAKGIARIDSYLGLHKSWHRQPQMPQRPYSQHEGAIQAFLGGGNSPYNQGGQSEVNMLPPDVMQLIGEQHGSENMAVRRDAESLATMAQISHPSWQDMRDRNYNLPPRYQNSWALEAGHDPINQ